LLIVPQFPSDSFWSYRYVMRLIGRKAAFPPLGVLTFAGYLPEQWDLELVDLNVTAPSAPALRRKIAEADVAFVSAMSIQKRSLVELLQGPALGLMTPFVLGGPFASSYRDQILDPQSESDRVLHDGLDVLVWGEAGASMKPLIEYLDSDPVHDTGRPRLLIPRPVAEVEPGSRVYLNDRSIFAPLEDVPLPRWDLIRVRDYQALMIQTTAGCPFRCDFCDIIQFNGGFSRPKAPAAVRRELEALLATGFRGSVFGVDDNFIGKPEAIATILDEVIEFQRAHGYPFSFLTQASVDLGTPRLEHLIRKMKLAGFDAVFLGIENPDPAALRGMNKKQNVKVDIPESVAKIQAAGIEVLAGFIFGSDEDTPSSADRIIEFVKRNRIFTAMAGMLTPVPHTPLFERLKRENRLRLAEYTGNNTDDEVQFDPRGMTGAQLREGMHHILYQLFNPAESYRRALSALQAVRPQIFVRRRLRFGYLKAAVISIWQQGVRRLDRDYFSLLWHALRLDHEVRRDSRRQARALTARLRKMGSDADALLGDARVRMEQLLELAHDYRVRFMPEQRLEHVARWLADTRERLRLGHVPPAEIRTVYDQAAKYLRVLVRRHRFPGANLAKAIEAAVKALHYEKVMTSIRADARALPDTR
jgi:radical SAM superfamily enzyme YgiQ (UPF0313 family)